MNLEQLRQNLLEVLKTSQKISDDEKEYLAENINLFDEEELELLINNNKQI